MQLFGNKNSYEATMIKTEPYKYIHIYNCLIESKHGQAWVEYPMFCDYDNPKSSESISELKNRFKFAYGQFRLVKFKVLNTKVNNG